MTSCLRKTRASSGAACSLPVALLFLAAGCLGGNEQPVEYRVTGAASCDRGVLTIYTVNGEAEDEFIDLPFTYGFQAEPGAFVSLYAFNACQGGGISGISIAIRHGGHLLDTKSVLEFLPPERYGRAGIGVGMFLPPLPGAPTGG